MTEQLVCGWEVQSTDDHKTVFLSTQPSLLAVLVTTSPQELAFYVYSCFQKRSKWHSQEGRIAH